MNLNFKKLRGAVAASLSAMYLLGGSFAVAAEVPAFNIEVVESQNGVGAGFKHGPFAVGLSSGTMPSVASRYLKNDAFSFFNLAPQQFNEGDRILHINNCYDYLDDDVCDAYWDMTNGAYDWRYDFLFQRSQVSSVVNGAVTQDYEMTYEAIDAGTDGVGSIAGDKKEYGYRELLGIAKFGGKTFILKSPVTETGVYGDYAQAFSFYKLSDGRILVGGLARTSHFDKDFFYSCYNGDIDEVGDYAICPGFRIQATIWLIDPKTMADGAKIVGVQPEKFVNASRDNDRLTIGNIRGFTTIGDQVYAIGHSMNDDYGGGKVYLGGIATYWPLNLEADKVSFKDNGHQFAGLEEPAHGDKENFYTDAKAVNSKGYVVINRKMDSSKNSNYAKVFTLSRLNADGSSSYVTYPLEDQPIKGANSEVAGINDHGLVVGWRDMRSENSPVNHGIARNQEGFIYNVNDKSTYYLNDLICSGSENAKKCAVNGKYYAISWPVAINNDNVILATAFEYGSYEDFANMIGARVVNVLLKPNAATFKEVTPTTENGTTTEPYITIDPSLAVSNYQSVVNEAEVNKDGRGAFDMFSLLGLLGLGLALKRRKALKA